MACRLNCDDLSLFVVDSTISTRVAGKLVALSQERSGSAYFCFVLVFILAELENVRAGETSSGIADYLVRAVLDLKPTTTAPSGNESGERRLLNRLRGAVKSALSNAPSRSLSVSRAPPSASWCRCLIC